MYSEAHCQAYFLDPRHVGHSLSAPDQEPIEDVPFAIPLVENKEATKEDTFHRCEEPFNLFIAATTRRSKNGVWSKILTTKRKSRLEYWLAAGQNRPALQLISIKVLSMAV